MLANSTTRLGEGVVIDKEYELGARNDSLMVLAGMMSLLITPQGTAIFALTQLGFKMSSQNCQYLPTKSTAMLFISK